MNPKRTAEEARTWEQIALYQKNHPAETTRKYVDGDPKPNSIMNVLSPLSHDYLKEHREQCEARREEYVEPWEWRNTNPYLVILGCVVVVFAGWGVLKILPWLDVVLRVGR